MKIADIQTYVVKMPNDIPYLGVLEDGITTNETGYFQRPHYPTFFSRNVEGFLVQITTDEGIVGWGEAQAPLVPEVLEVIVQRLFKPFYLGHDAGDIEGLWSLAYRGIHERGHFTSFPIDALAACDIALWDILGKAAGLPLHRLVGSSARERVPCYVSGLPEPTLEGRVALAREWVEKGYGAIKMSMGYGVNDDLGNLEAVMSAAGDDLMLMLDAHWCYSLPEATRLGRGMEEIGCEFLEAPLVPEDLDGLAQLVRELDINIAMGEERRTRYQFRDVFEKGSADVVQPDIGRTGFTEFRKIAALADAHSIPVVPHQGPAFGVFLAAGVQAAASVTNVPIIEWQPSVFEKANSILEEPVVCENGHLMVPQGPGLGVTVNEEALEPFVVRQ